MTSITEHFIKGSDNEITLTLTEDEAAISGAWTDLDIDLCAPNDLSTTVLNISRASNSNGIELTSGVLSIVPGALTETLTPLVVGRLYRVFVTVKTATQTYGADFGRGDSTNQLYFLVEARSA